jgi:hypothetical protein
MPTVRSLDLGSILSEKTQILTPVTPPADPTAVTQVIQRPAIDDAPTMIMGVTPYVLPTDHDDIRRQVIPSWCTFCLIALVVIGTVLGCVYTYDVITHSSLFSVLMPHHHAATHSPMATTRH